MSDQARHVLLVEDETPLRQAIAEQLSDRGYHVEQAESGEIAVALLADFAFDITLTALRLPGIDGYADVAAAAGKSWSRARFISIAHGTCPASSRSTAARFPKR